MAEDKQKALTDPAFYQFLDREFKLHGCKPFSDISLAIIGGWRAGESWDEGEGQTVAPALPLLKKFKKFYDIAERKTGVLRTDNALELTKGKKVDYVITCNVINAPDNPAGDDTFLAVANLLKPGGRVIHVLGCGECDGPYEGHKAYRPYNIDLDSFHKLAGQQHLYNNPKGSYDISPAIEADKWKGGTRYMMLEQERTVNHSAQSLAFYNRAENDYVECLKSSRDRHIKTGDADLSRKAFYTYFMEEHPERIPMLQGSIFTDLNAHEEMSDRKARAEFYLKRAEAYGFQGLEEWAGKKGKHLSPRDAEKVIPAYMAWRDRMISAIVDEITPQEIGDATFSPATRKSWVAARAGNVNTRDSSHLH